MSDLHWAGERRLPHYRAWPASGREMCDRDAACSVIPGQRDWTHTCHRAARAAAHPRPGGTPRHGRRRSGSAKVTPRGGAGGAAARLRVIRRTTSKHARTRRVRAAAVDPHGPACQTLHSESCTGSSQVIGKPELALLAMKRLQVDGIIAQ